MTSQPDYTIIARCLAEVVRPEKPHPLSSDRKPTQSLLRHRSSGMWAWQDYETGHLIRLEDDSDALAVVSVCIIEHLLKTSYCTIEAWASHCGGVQFAASSSGTMAYHPDRTTALCLLALRVVGEETKGDSDGG